MGSRALQSSELVLQNYFVCQVSKMWFKLEMTQRIGIFLVVLAVINGVSCLQCEVGINEDIKAMDCKGSWEHMKSEMKDKFQDHWDDLQNDVTSGMTSIIESFKGSLSDALESAQNSLQNALTPSEDGRKKRDVGEDGTAEPEPEPEVDDYYCIKKSLGNNTVKSCMPKSVADPLKMICTNLAAAGTVCVCNDQDLCNSANQDRAVMKILLFTVAAALFFRN